MLNTIQGQSSINFFRLIQVPTKLIKVTEGRKIITYSNPINDYINFTIQNSLDKNNETYTLYSSNKKYIHFLD